MKIVNRSMATGRLRTRDIPLAWNDYVKWCLGVPIQYAAPYLNADDREFLISGITPDEWTDLFSGRIEEDGYDD